MIKPQSNTKNDNNKNQQYNGYNQHTPFNSNFKS